MRKIAVVTGTRAEYGVLKNILTKIEASSNLKLQLIVTGAHLSEKFGYTLNDILNDGFSVAGEIPILMGDNNESNMAKEMGILMVQLSQAFERLKPDLLLIVGDRYEVFAAAATAIVLNIPIAHISGGEVTEAAMDEQIRHAITKMAHVHFPGTDIYARNIANMGEELWRIFSVGDPGIENIKLTNFLSKEELEKELDLIVDENTLLVTYHPVTLEKEFGQQHTDNLIHALNIINRKVIITYPNCDDGSDYIIHKMLELADKNPNVHLFKNLGSLKYLSVMRLCGAIVGNSSSALIEAPYLKIPAVNIGNRQKGRLMADNVICCNNECEEIVKAINKSLSQEFREIAKNTKSLYGEGDTSTQIIKILENIELGNKLLKKKLVWSW